MSELIDAVAAYAPWLYVLLGVLAARQSLVAVRAIRERRHAVFELEGEAATGRLVRALVTLLLLLTIAMGIFAVAEVLAPALPERMDTGPSEQPFVAPTVVAPLPPPSATPTDTPAPAEPPVIVTATP